MRQRLNQGIGEESPAAMLFHRHAPAIFAFLCQRTASQEDAEDLLLEVFVATQVGSYSLGKAYFPMLPQTLVMAP